MEIDTEANIIVRYIPQYIVIETRNKPREFYADEEIDSKTTIIVKNEHENDRYAAETTINFDHCDANDVDDDIEFDESKQINSLETVVTGSPSKHKKRNKQAANLLNEWFMSHLQNPYPTEDEKESLMSATNMTKVQINYWFINKRKRNKHLLKKPSKPSVESTLYEDIEQALMDESSSNGDGTTVELEVIIQPSSQRKRRQRKPIDVDSDSPAICDVCGKTFPQRYMLQSHLKRHDPSTWEMCDVCHKRFPDGLKRHMRVHSGERPYVCHECGAAYKQAYGLTMHRAIHNDSGESFYCDMCNNGKSYKSKYALKDHLKLHYRVRNDDSTMVAMKSTWKPPKVCTLCGFETYNIRSHMIARHSSLRPFKCEICTETFKFKKDLQTHYAYHSDEMNFECDECEKRFKTKRKLVIHKRIHTSEKAYKCTECDKSFLVSTYLKKHMRLHTGEKKRYACTECTKDYSGITDLRRHLEREHGIRIQPNPKYANNNMTKKQKIT